MFRIIGPILSIVTAIVVFAFFVRPMYAEIRELQVETTEYQEAVAKAEQFNALLDQLISKQNKFSAFELERLDAFLPSEIDEVRVLSDLEGLATSHGLLFDQVKVTLEKINFDDEIEAESPGAQQVADSSFMSQLDSRDVSFNVLGNYEQFKAFLRDVEQSLVLMEVVSIKFGVSEGDLTNYSVTVRLFALGSGNTQSIK